MALVPVGGWIAGGPSGLTISDGKRYITAPTYESLLILILREPFRDEKACRVEPPAEVTPQSPFSPSASRQTGQHPSASTEDSRDE